MKALKRAYHHGDLRNALVAEALHLLEKSGTSDFTLRDLAKRVGVSYAAPYAHFEDKRALLAATAAGGADQLTAALLEGMRGKADPVEQFIGMGQAYVQFGIDHPSLYRLMFTAWELTPQDKHKYPELQAASERSFKTLTDMLERMQASGFLRRGMVEADALTIWAQVHGVAMLAIDGRIECATDNPPPVQDVLRYSLSAMLDGLRA